MKKILSFILVLIMVLSITACGETKDELKSDIDNLKTERANLQEEVANLTTEKVSLDAQVKTDKEDLKLIEHKLNGGDVKYILTLELKQSHFTLDLAQIAKDELNKTEFEVAVDKEFYDQQTVGAELVRKFRTASFVLGGTVGDWVVTVVDKKEVAVE